MQKEQPNPNKRIDLSSDNIELPSHHAKTDPKSLLQENRLVRKQNEVLKRQLEGLSTRLDSQIKKRLEDQKKRPWSKPEDVSHMQLQNAYKKCEIYRRQVSFYRKKLDNIGDMEKVGEYENKASQYQKENQELREQLKYLKKMNKLQQKGLTEIGAEGYVKLVGENEKLQGEVSRLKKQLDEYRRGKENANRSKTEADNYQSNRTHVNNTTPYGNKEQKQDSEHKKRIKTQQPDNSDDNIETQQLKMDKDMQRIRTLTTEKNKLREQVENMKIQLNEKDKEIAGLKEKVSNLRKNNQLLQNQLSAKNQQQIQENPSKIQKAKLSRSKVDSTPQKRVWKRTGSQHGQESGNDLNKSSKYPRNEQRGSKMENSIKWTHQAFSSKMKQIQVLLHQNGHIRDLHARYEKGEPKKYESVGKGVYKILTCAEGEYIKGLSGCFKDGYLQCLSLKTSNKRTEKYGRTQFLVEDQEGYFSFEIEESEYPVALYGQNDQNGIRKLGCMISKQ